MDNVGESFELQMQWVGDMVSPPAAVNQFILQTGPNTLSGSVDMHHVTFGYVVPPMLAPDMPREIIEQIVAQPVPVMPVGRFVLSAERLKDLHTVIGNHLAQNGLLDK